VLAAPGSAGSHRARPGKSLLSVAGLSVRYGKHLALAQANFSMRCGEIVVLLGVNDARKSSCLKA
jgi:branched-chain amino acid transport system ATP-binding protein